MNEPDYKVRPGGLMRCCLATLDATLAAADKPPQEGDMMRCRYCDSGMIFRDGAWGWNMEKE